MYINACFQHSLCYLAKRNSVILPKSTPTEVLQMLLDVEQQCQGHGRGRKWHPLLHLKKATWVTCGLLRS